MGRARRSSNPARLSAPKCRSRSPPGPRADTIRTVPQLPLAEWPDPSTFRVVTYAAIVPSTIVIEGGGRVPDSPEMFVLTIDATSPGKKPPGEPVSREVLCLPVELARQIAAAFNDDLHEHRDWT